MQNYSKNFVARTLAWILAIVMVVSMVPMNVFAEGPVQIADGVDHVSADNWEEKIEAENDYWEIPQGWKGRNMGGLQV